MTSTTSRYLIFAIAAAAALAAGAAPPASAAAGPAKAAVEVCGQGPAVVRPTSMILTCADNGELAESLTWSRWTPTSAAASGTVTWRAQGHRWETAAANVILTGPVAEAGKGILFTRLELRVTGPTPKGFMRELEFDETPLTATLVTSTPAASRSAAPAASPAASAAASGTLAYAAIEGYWIDAGGPTAAAGSYNDAQIAAAITGAESSFLPGNIQQGVDYCGAGADRAGWGLWQLTCGNSVPADGTDFQLLDPWNNAEAAVSKCLADMQAGDDCFDPWSTYTSGAYTGFLQSTGADTQVTDPGEYVQYDATPPGTPASPAADPGSTYGPRIPGTDGFEAAFQSNANILYGRSSAGTNSPTGLGMAAGTSPAVTQLTDGSYENAFQANTGDLYLHSSTGSNIAAGLGMEAGTSPAIAGLTGGGWEAAFEANTGMLYLHSSTGTDTNTGLGMEVGTSPSITALPDGGWVAAFEANTGILHLHSSDGTNTNTGLGMEAGTDPSVAALPDGGWVATFEANTGDLYTTTSTGTNYPTGLGMKTGTSPAIAVQGNTAWTVAFEANNSDLYLFAYDSGVTNVPVGLGMYAGTDPAVTALSDGSYEVAIEANTGDLYLHNTSTGTNDNTGLGMETGTNPAIG